MIRINCECGQKLKIDDKYAGKKIRCPKCEATLIVPSGEDMDDLFPADAPTQRMSSVESGELNFKTLSKLKARDELVDLEEETEELPPPPSTPILIKLFVGLIVLSSVSATAAGWILLVPDAYKRSSEMGAKAQVDAREAAAKEQVEEDKARKAAEEN